MNKLKAEYLNRALAIDPIAVNLVREFFGGGVTDNLTVIYQGGYWGLSIGSLEWCLSDLDRALDIMEKSQ